MEVTRGARFGNAPQPPTRVAERASAADGGLESLHEAATGASRRTREAGAGHLAIPEISGITRCPRPPLRATHPRWSPTRLVSPCRRGDDHVQLQPESRSREPLVKLQDAMIRRQVVPGEIGLHDPLSTRGLQRCAKKSHRPQNQIRPRLATARLTTFLRPGGPSTPSSSLSSTSSSSVRQSPGAGQDQAAARARCGGHRTQGRNWRRGCVEHSPFVSRSRCTSTARSANQGGASALARKSEIGLYEALDIPRAPSSSRRPNGRFQG